MAVAASVLATVRATEGWSPASIAAGVVLVLAIAGAGVVWVIRVTNRR